MSLQLYNRARGISVALLAAVALAIPSCAPQIGLTGAGRSQFGAIAVAPQFNDTIYSVYYASALGEPQKNAHRSGWNVSGAAGQMAREMLNQAGASVQVVSAAGAITAPGNDVLVLLQQAPLDRAGRAYDPGRTFLVSGAGVMIAESLMQNKQYQQRTVLVTSDPAKEQTIGLHYCAVGVKPTLLDATTGEVLKEGVPASAQEDIPAGLLGGGWSSLGAQDRKTAKIYCDSALRRAVSQALAQLDIVR